MGNNIVHQNMSEEDLYPSKEIERQYSRSGRDQTCRMSSRTQTISDRFRSAETLSEEKNRQSPEVSNFAERHLEEITVESAPRILEQYKEKKSEPIAEIDVKVLEPEVEVKEAEEEKYLSLCLMAMNLESMIDEAEFNQPLQPISIEPATLEIIDHQVYSLQTCKKAPMDIEVIGNMSVDCSAERPRIIVKDREGNQCYHNYLKPSLDSIKKRNDMATLNNSMHNMVQMVQLLHNKIGVLEERVRYVENSYSLSQSLKE